MNSPVVCLLTVLLITFKLLIIPVLFVATKVTSKYASTYFRIKMTALKENILVTNFQTWAFTRT